jgi:hypothetical protein
MNWRLTLRQFYSRNPFRLRLHCWGGLGSQLFAIAVAYELRHSGFKRKIQLILHSSGVTMRASEISHLDLPFSVQFLNDFAPQNAGAGINRIGNIRKHISRFSIKILKFLRIIVSSGDLKQVKPWTVQLRGHYTDRKIPQWVLIELHSIIKKAATPIDSKHEDFSRTAIHYRLGDLVFLPNKTYVDPSLIVQTLKFIHEGLNQGQNKIAVYSDSPETAEVELRSVSNDFNFSFMKKSTLDTIFELVKYDNFVSTNSKVGIWVVLFRSLDESGGLSLVPKQLRTALEMELSDSSYLTKIQYY